MFSKCTCTLLHIRIKGACQAVFTCGQIVAASCAAVKHYGCHVELVHDPSNIIILWSYKPYP